MIGKPCARKSHARFDEGELEIGPHRYYASSLLYPLLSPLLSSVPLKIKFARGRRPEWPESVAVGGEAFVRGIKERLGIRARGRKVVRGESGFELTQ